MRRVCAGVALIILVVAAAACSSDDDEETEQRPTPDGSRGATAAPAVEDFVYQLQGYADDSLDELAEAPQELAVIDLARDARGDYFTEEEIDDLQESGKTVLAYFEIGSIEDFRPEYEDLPDEMILNVWPEWPEEHFVRYWEAVWWDTVVRPRVDQAFDTGFDGVYLDTPLAYEEIDLSLVGDESRSSLGRKMAELIVRISEYSKDRDPSFLVFPQNSPELREYPGYVDAIDGLGVEELFFTADDTTSDQPCTQDWCPENLAHVRALRDAGKVILAVDYASESDNVAAACEHYREEGFAGYVTDRALDTITPSCP